MTALVDAVDVRLGDRDALSSIQNVVDTESRRLGALKAETSKAVHDTSLDLQRLKSILDETKARVGKLRPLRDDISKRVVEAGEPTEATRVVARLDALKSRLNGLEHAKGYLQTLLDIEQLSFQVVTNSNAQAYKVALASYSPLYDRWLETVGLKGPDAQSKLDRQLSDALEKCFTELKPRLVKRLNNVTQHLGWPSTQKMKQVAGDPAAGKAYQDAKAGLKEGILDLITLQRPGTPKPSGMVSPWNDSQKTKPSYTNEPLLAIKVLLDPVVTRFKYHFTGSRPTNRLDKPEWMFSHVSATIREHGDFLDTTIQPIVAESGLRTVDAKMEFIRGLCAMLSEKIQSDMPRLLLQPNIMTHYIYETLSFDNLLKEEFGYRGIDPGNKVSNQGVGSVFTSDNDWYEAWLRVEKTVAKESLNAALEDPEAFAAVPTDEDSDLRPTKSSEELLLLIEGLVGRAQLLPDVQYRLPFVNDIALVLLDDYLTWIRDSAREVVDASASTFSLLGTETVKLEDAGVVSVCRWIGAVAHVSSILDDWGEALPFLEMWQFIIQLDSRRSISGETSVFTRTIIQYKDIGERLFVILNRGIFNVFARALRFYERKRSWSQSFGRGDDEESEDDEPSASLEPFLESLSPDISAEFCRPLSILAHSLELCAANLSADSLRSLVQALEQEIDTRIIENVVEKNHFSAAGALQFEVDIQHGLVNGVFRKYLRRPEAHFKKVRNAVKLLTVPMETMQQLVDDDNESDDSPWRKLNLTGFSEDEARYILSRRTDW